MTTDTLGSRGDPGYMCTEAIELPPEAVVERMDELLELKYRSASLGALDDPLAGAIYLLLGMQNRQAVYKSVFEEIRSKFPDWLDLAQVSAGELKQILKPASFQQVRAQKIQLFLASVVDANEQRGLARVCNLDYLRGLSDAEALKELTRLPGLGPKTARRIMAYVLGRGASTVDAHVKRVFDRLGIVSDREGEVDHERYEQLVHRKMRNRLHVNLVHHGGVVCGRKPRCGSCSLISFCRTGQSRIEPGSKPVAVEVFAGAGGLALGFEQGGFTVAVAVEKERNAAQTHRANHPGTVVLEADVARITPEHIRAVAPWMGEVTAVIGGPPCQGYSVAGKRNPKDKNNELFKHQVRLAKGLKARFVVMENVLGMRSIKGISFSEAVERELREAGYHARGTKIRASDYGVPQLRRRLIFTAQLLTWGNAPRVPRGDFCGSLDSPCRCRRPKGPTLIGVLEDPGLPRLPHKAEAEYRILDDGRILLNGSTMHHSSKVVYKISHIEAGKGPISYRRLHRDLARTIVAGHRALPVHPLLHRTISVREAARIQGFPDDYVFCGRRGNQPLQVANAVPPALGRATAQELLRVINEKPGAVQGEEVDDICGPSAVQLALSRSDIQEDQPSVTAVISRHVV